MSEYGTAGWSEHTTKISELKDFVDRIKDGTGLVTDTTTKGFCLLAETVLELVKDIAALESALDGLVPITPKKETEDAYTEFDFR